MMFPGKVFINQNAKIFNIFLGFKRKAAHFMLYHLVCARVEGTSKQDVSDDGLLHLCNSLQAPEVQTVVSHDLTVIPSWQSWNSVSIAANTLLKSVGERTQPCFTPFVMEKASAKLLLSPTRRLFAPYWRPWSDQWWSQRGRYAAPVNFPRAGVRWISHVGSSTLWAEAKLVFW